MSHTPISYYKCKQESQLLAVESQALENGYLKSSRNPNNRRAVSKTSPTLWIGMERQSVHRSTIAQVWPCEIHVCFCVHCYDETSMKVLAGIALEWHLSYNAKLNRLPVPTKPVLIRKSSSASSISSQTISLLSEQGTRCGYCLGLYYHPIPETSPPGQKNTIKKAIELTQV